MVTSLKDIERATKYTPGDTEPKLASGESFHLSNSVSGNSINSRSALGYQYEKSQLDFANAKLRVERQQAISCCLEETRFCYRTQRVTCYPEEPEASTSAYQRLLTISSLTST